ncbi:MAG: M48 family metalloprotease [Rickettsiales bacterium]
MPVIRTVLRNIFLLLFIPICLVGKNSWAVVLIRDAEIESTLKSYSEPVFKAAGINSEATNIFIVQDDSINAYVTGGANIFINTGLIIRSDTPDVLIGVIAHEVGHIAGGHLTRSTQKMKETRMANILSLVLGTAAAVISKKPEAAAAVITGGQSSIYRDFLSYSRANEQSADQSAINSLDKLGISANGMLKLFNILKDNERQKFGQIDPYMVTHPLTSERIEFIKNHIKNSVIKKGSYPAKYKILHQRMLAKLYAFLNTPTKTIRKYPESDKSLAGRMARAIAYYKIPDLEKSIIEINSIIQDYPNDPFLYELKGQILFENRRKEQALTAYQKAVELLPNYALILADLARVELAHEDNFLTKKAITHLEKSVSIENNNPQSWRLLATAYGRIGNMSMSYLSLAEEALLNEEKENAIEMVNRALSGLTASSPSYRRAHDLKNKAKELKDDKNL